LQKNTVESTIEPVEQITLGDVLRISFQLQLELL
jgi:hypothetical protein